MSDFPKSELLCPCCATRLNWLPSKYGVLLWCGNDKCNSIGASLGAQSETEEYALRGLQLLVSKQPLKSNIES